MEERRQKEAEEQDDDARRAAELRRQAEQDKAERKAAKAALQQHKKQLHREQVLEVKEEAKRRFKVGSCGCFVQAARYMVKHQAAGFPPAFMRSSLHRQEPRVSDMHRRLEDECLHGGTAVAGVMQNAPSHHYHWRSCDVQEYQGLLDDKDRWLHDAVLHGGKLAFTSQFDS